MDVFVCERERIVVCVCVGGSMSTTTSGLVWSDLSSPMESSTRHDAHRGSIVWLRDTYVDAGAPSALLSLELLLLL